MEFKIIKPDNDILNDFVFKNKYATIFQTGYMEMIYQNVPKCEAISLAAVDNNDEIIASLVGVKFIEKGGIFKHFSSHSTIRGGPIWVDNEIGIKAANSLIQRYDEITKNGSIYNRIYPFHENDYSNVLQHCGYQREEDLNFLIDLNRSKEDIWNSIRKKRRYGIRKAQQNNIKIKELNYMDDLKLFYKLLEETSHNAKISIKDFKLFDNILNILIPQGLARIFVATYNDIYIGGILVLTYKNIIYDLYACSTLKYNHLYPNDYLVWHVMSWGADDGYSTFDFGGAGSPDKKYSVREFKKQFGGKLVNYGKYTKVLKPLIFKLSSKCYQYIKIR